MRVRGGVRWGKHRLSLDGRDTEEGWGEGLCSKSVTVTADHKSGFAPQTLKRRHATKAPESVSIEGVDADVTT